ncbi:MAG: GMC family oxidoreductase [Pelagibacteraceae bacterium]|jgi:choline dehydrogenase-like flavoprotein|nr:GMC family oxidoreductase [Pelagibacteraceae bacterium]MBT4645146.1 GMC family oxidoreductase [Pelagibacteraceae bacterium]MBT6197406.1 GMC family oxidoreductase [Pelagibacteraceae bacterium]MBT6353586.1 GMC family oxidoreductase [Pelagibacteraceae bacterium]
MLSDTDYIVIGGGASGCAITSSLLKNNSKVTLFEAGHSHHNFLLNVPAGFFKLLNSTKYAEYYKTKPQHHLGGKTSIIPQGNVLGGGTSINSQIYMRGRSEDYNEWNDILRVNNDNVEWNWETLLPYFKSMENNERFENEYHGKKGQLNVSNSKFINPLTYDFIDSVSNLGVRKTEDFNGEFQQGVGKYQYMNAKGRRSSAAHAFIDPEINNPNLNLKLNTKVIKIIIENSKAIGVQYEGKNGVIEKIYAKNEVVLAAGSFVTPKILNLSGIGDSEELNQHEINCINHLPGVGKNLIDHPECPIIAKANGKYGYFKEGEGWRMIKNGLEFLLFGSGPVNSTGVEAGAFLNPINPKDLSYIQAFFIPSMYMYADTIGVIKEDYGMSITTVMTKPKSRGFVKLRSANYKDPPEIHLNLLSHEEDMKMMIAGQRFFLEVLKTKPLSNKIEKIIFPDLDNLEDRNLEEHCRKSVKTNYHPSGTTKMGADNDKMAVLDSRMRVRGIENLRVCDLSAMPNINSGNTSAPAMMLGLRCADLILGS